MIEIKNPIKYLGNEINYLLRVLEGESWSATSGSWTFNLEKEFSKKFQSKYAVAFNSGTATLHAALEAVGVRAGDEVISPALTVMMDSTATFHANAVPVYVDVKEDTFNMDPIDLEKKITSKTKAIVVVAIYGLSCDLDPIMAIAKKHNIPVIEDNAQAFLSYYKGKLLGTIGDISSFSFENTKHLSCGEGGIIITNNESYAEKCRKLGGHGFKNLKAEEGRIRLNQEVFQDPDYKRHDSLGWNYRLSEFSSAIALAQLERIEELVGLRQKNAEIFMDVFSSCNFLIPQYTPDDYINSYYTLGVKYTGQEEIGVSWQDFRKEYVKNGGDGIYAAWSLPYLEPLISERAFVDRNPHIYKDVHYKEGLCPVAESLQKKLMQFKSNYRDEELCKEKAALLQKVINNFK